MNIFTDRVIRKRFSKAIDTEQSKHSLEYRVLATLRYKYPGKFEHMIQDDSPDLQDEDGSCGVEVVKVCRPEEEKDLREYSKRAKMGSSEGEKTFKSAIYRMEKRNGNKYLISSAGLCLEAERRKIETALSNKEKKADNYRRKFDKVGLALVYTENLLEEVKEEVPQWIKKSDCYQRHKFDFFFFLSEASLISVDSQTGKVSEVEIKAPESLCLKRIARMTVEKELNLDSEEWTTTRKD